MVVLTSFATSTSATFAIAILQTGVKRGDGQQTVTAITASKMHQPPLTTQKLQILSHERWLVRQPNRHNGNSRTRHSLAAGKKPDDLEVELQSSLGGSE